MNTLVRLSSVLLCALIFVAAPQVQAADPAIDAITQAVARPEVLRGQFSQEKQVSGFRTRCARRASSWSRASTA